MSSQPIVTIHNLSVRRGGQPVLEGIDWQIKTGEQWALVGPNGSGKTTLVMTLAGMLPSAAGKIVFHPSPEDNGGRPFTRDRIGFVSADQHRAVFEQEAFAEEARLFAGQNGQRLRASDFIRGRSLNGTPPAFSSFADLIMVSRRLGIPETLLEKPLIALTTGEISKLLILRALLKQPRLLLLDEPFTGLDRESAKSLARLTGRLIRSGVQTVLITHRLDEIPAETSHVMLMAAGKVRKTGTKNEILEPDNGREGFSIRQKPQDGTIPPEIRPGKRRLPKPSTTQGKPPASNGPALVEMVDVCVRYGGTDVLKHLHWKVRPGENWMVHGRDGAGKTTLLKLITGENLQAYANDIFLFGKKKGSGESLWEIREKVGWISSDLQSKYPTHIRGIDVVVSGFFDSIGLYRTASAEKQREAERLCGELGIDHLTDAPFGTLSHGQKQMLLIARALVKSPPLLLLDEPCEGLDVRNRAKILEIIEGVCRRAATVLVYATGDDALVASGITHGLFLKNGRATVAPIPFIENTPIGKLENDVYHCSPAR